jgi:hypothetical protein
MSFFDTEELHAVMPDKVADRGGRAALKVTPSLQDCGHLLRGQAPAWIIGKEHPLKHLPSSVQKKISISFTVASSSRMDGNSSCSGAQAIIEFFKSTEK